MVRFPAKHTHRQIHTHRQTHANTHTHAQPALLAYAAPEPNAATGGDGLLPASSNGCCEKVPHLLPEPARPPQRDLMRWRGEHERGVVLSAGGSHSGGVARVGVPGARGCDDCRAIDAGAKEQLHADLRSTSAIKNPARAP